MKYKEGDKVRIKSLDWYNENKNHCGEIPLFKPSGLFVPDMSRYCNNIMTIKDICYGTCYRMKEDFWHYNWTDEMIEGLVEEEAKPKFKVGDEVRIKGTDIGGTIESIIRGQLIVETKGLKIPVWPEEVVLIEGLVEKENTLSKNAKLVSERFAEDVNPSEFEHSQDTIMKMLLQGAINLPEGYQFVDENGNVINATKIVLEKKKKEYPKTYEECCEILDIIDNRPPWHGYRSVQLKIFQKLLICRDAYWKIAGEEFGLGKPWAPDYVSENCGVKYCIGTASNEIIKCTVYTDNSILSFPTAEMRDAFYENFKSEIESCKELL